MKLAIPFFHQKTEFTCGPASLEMVMRFLGKRVSEEKIRREAGTAREHGTSHQGMIEAATKEGFYCYINEASSLHEAKHFLELHIPVIVDYTEPSDDEGHYAVVTGFSDNAIILNDPWNGRNFSISEKEFLRRWYDRDLRSNRWLIIVSDCDFNVGRQYKPTG